MECVLLPEEPGRLGWSCFLNIMGIQKEKISFHGDTHQEMFI